MSVRPLRDAVIVSRIKEDERAGSGLIIKPSTVENRVVNGKVLAVGSGHLTNAGAVVPLEVQVGDVVVFDKQLAVELKIDGETVYRLREEHILGVME